MDALLPDYNTHNLYPILNWDAVPLGINSTPPPYVLFSPFFDQIKFLIQRGVGNQIGRYHCNHVYSDKGDGLNLKDRSLTNKEELNIQEEEFIYKLLELVPFTRVSQKYKGISIQDRCNLISIREYNTFRGKVDLYFCGVESKSMSLQKAYRLIKMHIRNVDKKENTKENTPFIIRGGSAFYLAKNVIYIP